MIDGFSIFQMNEYDWMMARSLEEAKEKYPDFVDPAEFVDEREITESELDRLTFYDENAVKGSKRTFREELKRRINAGENYPQFFASSEW